MGSGGIPFGDRTRTTAEIIRDFYRVVADVAGDAVVIGCNTVGHLAAGLVAVNRTGDDTSGKQWERTRRMGVNTLAMRLAQHRCFFTGDAVGAEPAVPRAGGRLGHRALPLPGPGVPRSGRPPGRRGRPGRGPGRRRRRGSGAAGPAVLQHAAAVADRRPGAGLRLVGSDGRRAPRPRGAVMASKTRRLDPEVRVRLEALPGGGA